MPTRRHLAAAGVASALLLIVTAGCGSVPSRQAGGTTSQGPAGSSQPGSPASPTPSATPTTPPVQLKPNVDDGAKSVKVDTLVSGPTRSTASMTD